MQEFHLDVCLLGVFFSESQAPSAVLSCGRPSTSYLKRMAHLSVSSCTSSLLMIRIGTGRRHQIRLHCAHMGHVVVTDSKYAALDLYRLDTEWCPRNFLHRFSLTFWTGAEEMSAIEALPADLSAVLKVAVMLRSNVDVYEWTEQPKAWEELNF